MREARHLGAATSFEAAGGRPEPTPPGGGAEAPIPFPAITFMGENMSIPIDPVLKALRSGLAGVYGPRLRDLRIFGSQARGDAVEGSDIDVAMILDDFAHVGEEIDRTIGLVSELSLQYDCVISLIPIRDRDWRIGQNPFLMNLRRESLPLS